MSDSLFTDLLFDQVPSSYSDTDKNFDKSGWIDPNQRQFELEVQSSTYYCPNCGKMYMWKTSLHRHLRSECGRKLQLQCPYCPYVTKLKTSVQMHIQRQHKDMPNIG